MSAPPPEKDARAPPVAERPPLRSKSRRPRLDLWAIPVVFLLALSSLMVSPAQAEPLQDSTAAPATVIHSTAGGNCQNATCDLSATLTNIQFFLIGVAILLAGIAFAIYGIQHMLGSLEEMDPNTRVRRKNQFVAIIVGLVIVLMSVVLVSVAQGLIVG